MASQKEDRSPRRVKSVRTAMDILELLEEREGAGVTEIAGHLDLTKGTVHTQLATLRERGFVAQQDEEYHLGLRFLELGENAKRRLSVPEVAKRELDKLVEETDTRSQLVVEENGMAICVYLARGPNAILPPTDVGYREYLHCIASGKALMAHLPEERIESVLEKHGLPARTESTITDREALFAELAEIRERGYALNDEEKLRGLRAVGAPIIGRDGEPLGAISVSDTTRNMPDDLFHEEMPDRIMGAANTIEVNYNATHG
jgi:DNA-binding IclR family transcriptional regulator